MMPRGCCITSASYQAAIRLLGELGELQNGSADELRRHFMQRLSDLFGCAVWWTILNTERNPAIAEPTDLRVQSSDIYGLLDWQQRYWQRMFLEGGTYLSHPMWDHFYRQPGQLRTFRREQLIDDKLWYRNPFVNEIQRPLHYDDVVASSIALGGGKEALLALCRPWGDGHFEDRDGLLLSLIHESAAWVHRRQLQDGRCSESQQEQRTALPARHRRVLDLMLIGRSEKEIAAATELSARTVHKYIEQIYRTFNVHSRPELMAQWVNSGTRQR